MADLNKIVEDLSSLSEVEAAELSKLLEEKWGVSAAAPVAVAARNKIHPRHLGLAPPFLYFLLPRSIYDSIH